jgi:hypothetical protein
LQLGRGIPQGKDFRVSRRIARSDRRITAAPANLAIHYQYGAHWDFAIPLGLARKFQRLAHKPLVFSVHEVGGAAEVWMSISTLSSTFKRKLLGFFMPHFTYGITK